VLGQRHRVIRACAAHAARAIEDTGHTLFGVGDPIDSSAARRAPGTCSCSPMQLTETSLIWRLIISTRFSDVIGSWKIMAMSFATDRARTCSSDIFEMSRPLNEPRR